MQPGADDRQRFFRMAVDHFTDFLDGGFTYAGIDAAGVDHRARWRGQGGRFTGRGPLCIARGLAGRGQGAGHRRDMGQGKGAAGRLGGKHAVYQGFGHEQADQQGGQAQDRGLDDLEPVAGVQAQQRLGRRGGVGGVGPGKILV